ncbi:hypothetical protein VNO77_42368 [Canavalia gladiata]|uniref:FAS1 domain-containing protein n=1 Tax=Canavalia gladiata TaxID=3824 RepID=A0AAN9K0W3_CANGL
MASTTLLTLSLLLLLLSLSTLSSSSTSSTVLDAAEILSTSGFETMALNLELASQTLQTRSLTIFAPTDFAFKQIPHLPLSLLRYHLLPHAFSLHSLTSLPFGANIPTLLSGHSLTVTTTPHRVSINNITVNPSPIFHNHHLVIFATENFFDPYFQLPAKTPSTCFPSKNNEAFSFKEASSVLRSRGCSLMASLLDLQFPDGNRRQLTLFAPLDQALTNQIAGNLSHFPVIVHRHLVPCKILRSDLVNLEDGTLIGTYERGFVLNVTNSGTEDTPLLNGVPVIFPELYRSDWLVVHGLQEVLSVHTGIGNRARQYSDPVSEAAQDAKDSSSLFEFDVHSDVENSPQHYRFSVFN